MGGWAIVLAFICFLAPMAMPLFTVRWKSFLILVGIAVLFFGWMTLEVPRPGTIPSAIGAFLGGLMLTGFAFGAIARFISLVGRRPEPASPTESTTD